MRQALLISFHYPPFQGSSGVLRTLNFSKYLPDFGWQPLVLTAEPRAYGSIRPPDAAGLQIPSGVEVWRAAAWDAARHFSVRGRYPHVFALPDRWSSWIPFAVRNGMRIVRERKPSLIWSTYPIASTHLAASMLHRKTGLPWVADFRDSMTEDEYPRDPLERKLYRRIEARTVQEATVVVFTTIGTKRMYEERYPVEAHKFKVISNGYDEDAFKAAESRVAARPGGLPRTLLHSGVLYPIERDPRPFFDAIAALKKEGVISAANLQVVLRATSHDGVVRPMLVERGIEDIVKLEPGIPYVNALAELMTTDGLLLFQAANCNHQVPAKLYEYMRSGRPVLAMTDQRGDTAAILRQAGINAIVDIADATAIKGALAAFLRDIADGTAGVATREFAKSFSRRRQTGELAKVFEQVGVT